MMKHLEIWSSLYNNVKDIWVIILITGVFSFIKVLIQSNIYKANNILQIKAVFKHIMKYASVAFIAFIYLLIMIAFSLISYPTNEVSKYISNWDNIGSFAIILILYALLFPIIILPFFEKSQGKTYFIEIINHNIVKREILGVIDRNGKEKLILKDCNGYKTIKNVKDIDDMKFQEVDGEKWASRKNIENFVLSFKDKSKIIRMIFLVMIIFIPTAYLIWTLLDIPKVFNELQKNTDLSMYIGIFTLPIILIIELYYIAYVIYKALFKKK